MKEIIIKNKNGITLKTAGTLVQEDIKLTLDSSLSPSYENGDNLIYGEEGYTVIIATSSMISRQTKFKINEAPTSVNDYNSSTSTTTYSNVTKVYIWGYGYRLNDDSTFYFCGATYDKATVLEITSDCKIILCTSASWGGGSDD